MNPDPKSPQPMLGTPRTCSRCGLAENAPMAFSTGCREAGQLIVVKHDFTEPLPSSGPATTPDDVICKNCGYTIGIAKFGEFAGKYVHIITGNWLCALSAEVADGPATTPMTDEDFFQRKAAFNLDVLNYEEMCKLAGKPCDYNAFNAGWLAHEARIFDHDEKHFVRAQQEADRGEVCDLANLVAEPPFPTDRNPPSNVENAQPSERKAGEELSRNTPSHQIAKHTKPPHTLYYAWGREFPMNATACRNDLSEPSHLESDGLCIHCYSKRGDAGKEQG